MTRMMILWKKHVLVMTLIFKVKGAPKMNDTPSTSKKNNKNSSSKQESTNKSPEKEKENDNTKEKEKEREVIASKELINLYLTHKILGDTKLDYDVVDYLKKMMENITLFELCKITQLREYIRDALQHIQGIQYVVIGN